MTQKSLTQQRDELKRKMELLEKKQAKLEKEFSEFMRIFLEEADGVQSGAAPTIPNQPKRGYCM
ncbi:MAG: hypothetical protein NZ774_00510 [Candidatus Poseidoniales archaeon]|nr:hypothetical protein [Candidatus Poseidoniales archaeon]